MVEGGEGLQVYGYVFADSGVRAAACFYGDDAFAGREISLSVGGEGLILPSR